MSLFGDTDIIVQSLIYFLFVNYSALSLVYGTREGVWRVYPYTPMSSKLYLQRILSFLLLENIFQHVCIMYADNIDRKDCICANKELRK